MLEHFLLDKGHISRFHQKVQFNSSHNLILLNSMFKLYSYFTCLNSFLVLVHFRFPNLVLSLLFASVLLWSFSIFQLFFIQHLLHSLVLRLSFLAHCSFSVLVQQLQFQSSFECFASSLEKSVGC